MTIAFFPLCHRASFLHPVFFLFVVLPVLKFLDNHVESLYDQSAYFFERDFLVFLSVLVTQ